MCLRGVLHYQLHHPLKKKQVQVSHYHLSAEDVRAYWDVLLFKRSFKVTKQSLGSSYKKLFSSDIFHGGYVTSSQKRFYCMVFVTPPLLRSVHDGTQ